MQSNQINPFVENGAIVAAWDPGETTGVCIGRVVMEPREVHVPFDILYSGVVFWTSHYRRIAELLDEFPPAIILIEEFRLFEYKAKSQVGKTFPSVEVTGVIRTRAYDRGLFNRIIMQPPVLMSSMQILPTHSHLVHNSEHARDSYKHLRYYLVSQANRRKQRDGK